MGIRYVLFFETSTNHQEFNYTTPCGHDAGENIYNKVIQVFNDCIETQQKEESGED